MEKEEKLKLLEEAACFLLEAWDCLNLTAKKKYDKDISNWMNEILVLISKIREKAKNGK